LNFLCSLSFAENAFQSGVLRFGFRSPSNRSRRPARRESVSNNQCAHWLWKQFLQSVSRPEIPQNFMAHEVLLLRVEKPPWFFNAPAIYGIFPPLLVIAPGDGVY
jgi:hypothetical protein